MGEVKRVPTLAVCGCDRPSIAFTPSMRTEAAGPASDDTSSVADLSITSGHPFRQPFERRPAHLALVKIRVLRYRSLYEQ